MMDKTMRNWACGTSGVLACLVLAGCGGDTTTEGRDRGVTLPPPTELDRGIVARATGSDTLEWYNVATGVLTPVGSLVIEASGRVVVLDDQARVVSMHDRGGEGPGEFNSPWWVDRSGDSVTVFDRATRRLTFLSQAGIPLGSSTLLPMDKTGLVMPIGVLGEGRFLGMKTVGGGVVWAPQPVVRRDTFEVVILDSAGQTMGSVLQLAMSPSYIEPLDGGGALTIAAPLAGRSEIAPWQGGFVVSEGDSGTVTAFNSAGAVVWNTRPLGTVSGTPVTERHIAAARAQVQDLDSGPFDFLGAFDRAPKPQVLPVFGWGGARFLPGLVVSCDGDVWILEYGGLGSTRMIWVVLDHAGQIRSRFALDSVSEVLDACEDRVLLRQWDEFDVERVVLVELPTGR